ncbi:MAG: Ppx/GppA family phosphatase [Candidatus Kapaibacterium sp.]|nr:MAG: Ppx/GppA family phosphatase [Candidatus Kapabacteria bacterium]
MTCAAFDIGTNTFLMVIGTYTGSGIWNILYDAHGIARLGEGVQRTKHISPEAYGRAEVIAREYAELCKKYNVQSGYGVATSALRDADNGSNICEQLSSILGFEIRRISGEEEARLSFIGSSETDELQTVIDIGGGSTEYVTGENNHVTMRKSLQMGAVRLSEQFLQSVLPFSLNNIIAARQEIKQQLQTLPQAQQEWIQGLPRNVESVPTSAIGRIIGVGGTFTTLAAMDLNLQEFQSERVHWYTLSLPAISSMTEYLSRSSLAELLQNPAIHPQRADILPAGALILEESLKFFGAQECTVSTRGLRYGVLKSCVQESITHTS